MATSTRKAPTELQGGEQPLYQPWDDYSGRPQTDQSQSDFRDNGPDRRSLDNDSGSYTSDRGRTQNATNALRNAENGALSPGREQPSLYTGSGRNSDNNTKAKGKKKKIGALVTILIIIGGGGAFLGSSNTLLADAMEHLFTSQLNYQGPSFYTRANRLFKHFLSGDKDNASDNLKKYFVVSDEFKQKLANNGITFETSGNSKTMTWTHDTGNGIETISGIDGNKFDELFYDNVEFRKDYSLAANNTTLTYFDDSAEIKYRQLGTSRNNFNNYKTTGDTDVDTENYKNTLSPKFDGDSTTLQTSEKYLDTEEVDTGEVDSEGNPIKTEQEVEKRANSEASATTGSDVDANASANTMLRSIANLASSATSWACTVLRVGNMISMAVAANEMYQSIMFFMSLMEPISKMKAGFGMESPINSVLNWFNTKANTSTTLYGRLQISGAAENATAQLGDVLIQTGAPLQSNGVQMVLGGATSDPVSAAAFSHERINSSLVDSFSLDTQSAQNCAVRDTTDSVVSIGVTLASGGLSKIFANVIGRVIIGTATSIAVSAFFSFLIPTIAQVFFTNAFDTAMGEPGGELFAGGGDTLGYVNNRANNGIGPASEEETLDYNQTAIQVGALEAEVERYMLSPFDTSSPNTFLGSIAYAFLPIMTSSNGINNISSLIRSVSTSLSTILGGARAEGEGSSFMTNFGECPNIATNGAGGSRYCNPSPSGTKNIDPTNTTYQNTISQSQDCDSNGNCTIKSDSELAKYITYCKGRLSPSGVIDQNILAAMQPSNEAGTLGTVFNQIPLVEDAINFIDGVSTLQNIDWANDQKCSNTPQNATYWNEHGQYYAQYIEDMRVLDLWGSFEETGSKNPVLAYEEAYEQKYLEEHPEANTYIGYLSRISGLTPQNTETVLAFIDYIYYLDSYDPTVRIAMDGDTSKIKDGEQIALEILEQNHYIHFENDRTEDTVVKPIIANHYFVYADIRNRSYAVC